MRKPNEIRINFIRSYALWQNVNFGNQHHEAFADWNKSVKTSILVNAMSCNFMHQQINCNWMKGIQGSIWCTVKALPCIQGDSFKLEFCFTEKKFDVSKKCIHQYWLPHTFSHSFGKSKGVVRGNFKNLNAIFSKQK